MPILVLFTGNITKDDYEAIRKEVHWEDQLPPGALFHTAAFDQNGHAHVADVWESEMQMNDFVQSRLIPAFQKMKVNPPNVEVFPTHNINAYEGLSRYTLRNK